MDGMWGYWSSIPAGNSPASWLEKLRKVEEWPSVLPQYVSTKEWGGLPGVWSLYSWSPLGSSRLCFQRSVFLKGESHSLSF